MCYYYQAFSLKKFKLSVEEALEDEVGYGVVTLCLAHMHRQAAASASAGGPAADKVADA